jgi:hypothetical protein
MLQVHKEAAVGLASDIARVGAAKALKESAASSKLTMVDAREKRVRHIDLKHQSIDFHD